MLLVFNNELTKRQEIELQQLNHNYGRPIQVAEIKKAPISENIKITPINRDDKVACIQNPEIKQNTPQLKSSHTLSGSSIVQAKVQQSPHMKTYEHKSLISYNKSDRNYPSSAAEA
jgi:hypothetical protein